VEYAVVLILAVAAGIGVYTVSLRWDREVPDLLPGEGFLPEEERSQSDALQAAAAAQVHAQSVATGGEYAYVPMAPGSRSIQTRLLGLLGIVVLVPIAAVAFALATYVAGRFLVEAISRLIEKAIA
jgi:hypothetical protein